jgi:hypothetical protein
MLIRTAALTALVFLLAAGQADLAIGTSEFPETYWFADGVVIGRVVAEHDQTVDIAVDEWFRDRGDSHEKKITAYRYSEPSCVPGSDRPESYSTDTKYLFLVRQPNDVGAGNVPYWSILLQFEFDGSDLCLTPAPEFQVQKSTERCKPNLRLADLVDAVRSFESCFELYDDRILGTFPVRQICPQKELIAWRGRSNLHDRLAAKALDRMARKSRGGA